MASPPRSIHRQLLTWFRKNARPLPWRATRDPYAIWISEVMLQQTQVATVVAYFERFLEQYPTVQQLAQADEQNVLCFWEGLGYYRRARDLSRAARLLHENHYATIPDDPDFVRTLPGFGRYTTNAILSQAYDRQLPILEVNSQRVLCRLFGIDKDPKDRAVQKSLWQLAESLAPKKSCGDFNQALMELGALICTPAAPKCTACPLRTCCEAHRQNRQHEIPRRAQLARIAAVAEVAVVVQKRDRWLLVQRPDGGRWERMWEFPHQPLEAGETHEAAAQRLLSMLGIDGGVAGELATIRHSVTRFRITMTCLRVRHRGGTLSAGAFPDHAWVRLDDLHQYPLSTPQRRLARLLEESANDGGHAGYGKQQGIRSY